MMRLTMDVLDPRWLIAPNKARPDQPRATSYDESKAYLPTNLFIERVAAIADYFDATDPPARRAPLQGVRIRRTRLTGHIEALAMSVFGASHPAGDGETHSTFATADPVK
jgi:hypothetical protein